MGKAAFNPAIKALIASTARRRATLTISLGVALGAALWLTPPAEYLPEGEEPKTFASMIAPPGYNLDTMQQIGQNVEDRVRPLFANETGPEPDSDGRPKIENFFFVATESRTFVGASAINPAEA